MELWQRWGIPDVDDVMAGVDHAVELGIADPDQLGVGGWSGGEKDWNVPIQNSEQIYQALRRRGIPTELVVYPGQPHGIQVPSYQKDRWKRWLEWYDRHVKTGERPLT